MHGLRTAALSGLLTLSGCIASLSDPSTQTSSPGMSGRTSSGLFAKSQSQSPRELREDAVKLVKQQNWAGAAELYALSAELDQQRGTTTVQGLAWTFHRTAELWATADNMSEANQNWQHAAAVHRQAADKARASGDKPENVARHLISSAEYLLKAQDYETAVTQLQEALPFAEQEWNARRASDDFHTPYTLIWAERLLTTYLLLDRAARDREYDTRYDTIERLRQMGYANDAQRIEKTGCNQQRSGQQSTRHSYQKAHHCVGLEQTSAGSNYMSNRCDFMINVNWRSSPHCNQGCANRIKANTARSTVSPIKGSYMLAACEYPGIVRSVQGQSWTGGDYICR